MNEASRAQGWAICGAAALAALLFVIGLLNGSYWALAIPVAILTLFALGLVAWVGYTIATIQVEADAAPEILATDAPLHEPQQALHEPQQALHEPQQALHEPQQALDESQQAPDRRAQASGGSRAAEDAA